MRIIRICERNKQAALRSSAKISPFFLHESFSVAFDCFAHSLMLITLRDMRYQ